MSVLWAQLVCADGPAADPLAALAPIAAGRDPVNLGSTALVIAHAIDPDVRVATYEKRLDAHAAELRPAIDAGPDVKAKLERMAACVYGRWGFADRTALPADVFVSFADALDKRQWNCFSMSVLYIALGERIGLPFDLVSGRGHALVRCAGTPYYVETTDRGHVHEGVDYLAQFLPFPCLDPGEYAPVSARDAVAVLLTQTGGAVLAQRRPQLAYACFRHALDFSPGHAETHAALGFLYAQTGENARAIESFQMAIEADAKLREAYGGLGAALHAKGDRAGAIQALRKAVELCDEQPEPLFNLGQVLYENGDYAASIDAFRRYTVLAPADPDGHLRLAFPLEDSGRLDDALAAYREVLRLTPGHPDALVNSGAVLEKQRQWDSARAMYEECIRAWPDNALAYAGLGRVWLAMDRLDAAEAAFARALELDSANPATWIDYARLDRKRGDRTGAIRKLERALAINPAEAETHLELAAAYRENGDAQKADEHARAAEALAAVKANGDGK